MVDLSFLFHSLENNWLGTHRAHSGFPFPFCLKPSARGSFITKLCYLWLLSIAYFYNLNFNTSQLYLVSVTTVLPCLPMSPSLFCHPPHTEVSLLFTHSSLISLLEETHLTLALSCDAAREISLIVSSAFCHCSPDNCILIIIFLIKNNSIWKCSFVMSLIFLKVIK